MVLGETLDTRPEADSFLSDSIFIPILPSLLGFVSVVSPRLSPFCVYLFADFSSSRKYILVFKPIFKDILRYVVFFYGLSKFHSILFGL